MGIRTAAALLNNSFLFIIFSFNWFINFLPASDEELDWNRLLSDAAEYFGKILDTEFYNETVKYINKKSQMVHGVQLVREVNAHLKEQQSYYKSELTRLQSTVQSLIFYSDCNNSQGIFPAPFSP